MTDPNPFQDNADLLRAIEERPLTGLQQVPGHLLEEFERTRHQSLATGQHVKPTRFMSVRSTIFRIAAALVVLAVAGWLLVPKEVPTAHVVITSPGDEITNTTPTIAWNSKDKPGQKYDVWILPAEGDHLTVSALFKASSVTSPVAFAQLQPSAGAAHTELSPGTGYRVLVCLADAGRTAGSPIPFKVKPAP